MKKLYAWIDSLVNWAAKNYTLWVLGLLAAAVLIGLWAFNQVFPRLPQPPVYATTAVLQPEWSTERRELYYQTSQGSLVVPYKWYLSLESRTGTELFASPEVQARYGLLPDNNPIFNPDRLPVGIVKDVVPDDLVSTLGGGHKEWASISCAACHTGDIAYKGTLMRIDGNEGFWGFEQWSGDLVYSLMLTSATPPKFDRFCSRVYDRGGGKCTKEEAKALREQLASYFSSDLIMAGINEGLNHTYSTKEGFTRTAALGRGVNGQFGPLDYRNVKRNTGPVSYPPVWYTHQYDWVQSPAAIRQPLGRNVTEAWGVSVHVDTDPDGGPPGLWASTARMDDLFWIETLLATLQAPKWPENILGPIDRERAERGRKLFNEVVWDKALPANEIELNLDEKGMVRGPNPGRPATGLCARCHAPALEPGDNPYKIIQLPLYDMKKMGTDPADAVQFSERLKIYTGRLKDAAYKGQETVGIGTALTVAITGIEDNWFTKHQIDRPCRDAMEGFRENLFRAPPAYPARPLDGYWATGPFLHNGSVRTLYELLSPASERAKTFYIGTREFDPLWVGFRNDKVEGAFVYDTSEPGNSNKGHEFREAPRGTDGVIGPLLSPDQRLDIIEYLKVLDSGEMLKQSLARSGALLDALAPWYEKSPYAGNRYANEGRWKKSDICGAIGPVVAAGGQYPAPAASPSPGATPAAAPAATATPRGGYK